MKNFFQQKKEMKLISSKRENHARRSEVFFRSTKETFQFLRQGDRLSITMTNQLSNFVDVGDGEHPSATLSKSLVDNVQDVKDFSALKHTFI